ncbi:hypothetical protein [Clostridium sp. C2-6-12]|uniref:hypothetical protein n=1 Tax=Clostridium sp. C2-6-12 TaxID=2698832 RepID=UPI00136DF2F2|nr:hypothetical protein [Clostridium sp. C2-6-12]
MLKELSEITKQRKERRWMELTSLIVNEIEWENDMAFCKLEHYKSGECFSEDDDSKILYGFSEEEIWDRLFEVSGTNDYDDLYNKFKNAKWCDHENLMLFELVDGAKLCALRL